jgi:uncharacterized membrane-anchored protein YhcB (DUF1043 family)
MERTTDMTWISIIALILGILIGRASRRSLPTRLPSRAFYNRIQQDTPYMSRWDSDAVKAARKQ